MLLAGKNFWKYIEFGLTEEFGLDKSANAELFDLITRLERTPSPHKESLVIELFQSLASITDVPLEFGLWWGHNVPLSTFDPMTQKLLISPTPRHSVELLMEFHQLGLPLATYDWKSGSRGGSWIIKFGKILDPRIEVFFLNWAMSAMHQGLKRITSRERCYHSIELTHDVTDAGKLYQQYFKCVPTFSSRENCIIINNDVLDFANPNADPLSFQEMRAQLSREIDSTRTTENLVNQARKYLQANIGSPPSLEQLAGQLTLSKRQLRALLARHGRSYRELLREIRMEHIDSLLLNPTLNLSEIANRLGYADLATFSHNFRRWTGTSPSEYRKQLEEKSHI